MNIQEVIKTWKMHRIKRLILYLVSTEDHFHLVIKVIMEIFPVVNQHTTSMLFFGRENIWKKEYPSNTKVLLQQISLRCNHGGCYAWKTDNHRPTKMIQEMRMLLNDRKQDMWQNMLYCFKWRFSIWIYSLS